MNILLTSGGTKTAIDDVRHVGNMSSGQFGCHLCGAFMERGHYVTFLYAKGSKAPHEVRLDLINLRTDGTDPLRALIDHERRFKQYDDENLYDDIAYSDFDDYAHNLQVLTDGGKYLDAIVLAAAVSDFAPIKTEGKISSETSEVTIKMVQTPKLIRKVKTWAPNAMLVGFKLLVNSTPEQLEAAMRDQKSKTGADIVVGNDLRDIKASAHALTVMRYNNEFQTFSNMNGRSLALRLVAAIEEDRRQMPGQIPF